MAADPPGRRAPRMIGELRALTAGRGIAAWMVVFYHIRLSVAGLPEGWRAVFGKGYLAVDFFFLLSGFVIWLTWDERLRTAGWRAVPGFLSKRVARIWPLHLVVLGAGGALALVLAALGRHDPARFPFCELPLHALLIQNWGTTPRLAWNDPAWSISCEVAAYLLFPLLVRVIDWQRWPSWLVVVGGSVPLLVLALAMRDAPGLGWDIARFGVLRCLAEFTAGGAVAALWLRWRDQRWVGPVALGLAATLVAGWLAGWLAETLAIPPAFALILLALALGSGRPGSLPEGRALHYLGEISYATYLSHFLLWFVFKIIWVADPHAVPPPLIALYLALLLGLSIALYHGVERPAQRWVNRLPARWRDLQSHMPAHSRTGLLSSDADTRR